MVPTPRRMSADERREMLVEAAVAEFAHGGLHGTSTEVIAARAGISHPYLFRLFGTKKKLFLACTARCHERLRATFTAAAESAPRADRLAAMGQAYKELLTDRRMLLMQVQMYPACGGSDGRRGASKGCPPLGRPRERRSGAP